MKETRLYFYPNKKLKVVHLLLVGDKKSQKSDIKFCHSCLQDLLTREE